MPLNIVPPVAGLDAGPATEARVRQLVGLDTDDHVDDLSLESAINAVNEMIVGWPCSEKFLAGLPADPDDRDGIAWPWRLVDGGTRLAAKLFDRRNSREGVVTFGAEGVAYVQRNDPEIAQLLQLGQWAPPKVG